MARRLASLVKKLCAVDPDIVEIVQFGSSVYAPRLARDVDLLVWTRSKKSDDVYWEVVESWDKPVDVLVKEPGEHIGADIAFSVLAFSRTLYGNGLARKEAKRFMGIPSYDDAHKLVTMADEQIERVLQERDPRFRDARYRAALDFLFDAARYAAMTFLATDQSRWGKLREKLPKPFNTQFRDFISTLHVQYVYEDGFPRDQADEQFKEWRGKVSAFVDALAAQSQSAKDEQR